MEEDGGEPPQLPRPTCPKSPISEPRLDPQSTCPKSTLDPSEDDRTDSKPTLLNQTELFRALEVVERLPGHRRQLHVPLRLPPPGPLRVLDAATKGNGYIKSCLSWKTMETLSKSVIASKHEGDTNRIELLPYAHEAIPLEDLSLANKQLRFVSRFLMVCLLLNRREMVHQLLNQLRVLVDERKRTFQLLFSI